VTVALQLNIILDEHDIIASIESNAQGTPLQTGFTFYYMRRSKKGNTAIDGDVKTSLTDKASFTDAVKPIGTCRTVEEFWSI
jgi:hypothetical protein